MTTEAEALAAAASPRDLLIDALFESLIRSHQRLAAVIDTTEGVGPIPVGYTEPAEQTGSDDETEPVHAEYVPVRERYDRNRIYFEDGRWWTHAPVGSRHFGKLDCKGHASFEAALETARIEDALASARAYWAAYRGVL